MGGQSRHRRPRGASRGGSGGRRCRRDPDLQTLETGRPEVCGPRAGERPATATGTSMAPRDPTRTKPISVSQDAIKQPFVNARSSTVSGPTPGPRRRSRGWVAAGDRSRWLMSRRGRPCARPPKCRTSRRRRWRTATRHHRVALALEPRGGGRGSATSRMRGGGRSVLSRRASRCGTRAAVHRIAIAPGWQGASVGFRRVIAVGNGCSAARDPRRWGR